MNAPSDLVGLTPQFDITVDDLVKYRGLWWTMARRRGNAIDFLDPRTGELMSITDEEFAGLICSDQARIVRGNASEKDQAYAAATADLAQLSSSHISDGRRIIAYVDEMKARGLAYRPANKDVEATIAHVAAKIADPQPPAVYLVKRWLRRGDARAAAGGRTDDQITVGDFVPQHGFKGNRTSRVSFEVSKIIHDAIETVYLKPERRSIETVLSTVRDKVRRENEKRDPLDQLNIPGYKALKNAIDSLPRDKIIIARYGSDEAYDRFGPVEYRPRPDQPLDEIEMDHTTCDLFVVDGLTGAPLGRPTIVIGKDRCTTMPWGVHVGFDPPSVHTVMQCLRNGMFPKSYVRIYADAKIWDIKNAWPVFGKPKMLSVDRGSENINADMKAIAGDLPLPRIEAKRGRKGRLKGGIERLLGTVNRTLLQEQRGTTFSNIVDRGDYNPKKNAVISYEELLEKIHQWLIDIYMRRRNGGIKDVPIRLWNELIAKYRPRQVENYDKILPLFGRIEHRILRRDGIRWKHLFFTSPELMALLSNPQFVEASKNLRGDIIVRFRYDPSNIDHIQVYLPHARGQDTMHLRVPIEKRSREYARGLSVWAHDAILKVARDIAKAAIDQPALDRAKAKLIAGFDTDMPGSAKVRGAVRLARLRQIGGVAPYGDSVRTTPAGSFEDKRQQAALEGEWVTPGSQLTACRDGFGLPKDFEPMEDRDDEDIAALEGPPEPTKQKYRRSSDPRVTPKSARGSRLNGKGRAAVPKTLVPAGDDDIDFYSEEINA